MCFKLKLRDSIKDFETYIKKFEELLGVNFDISFYEGKYGSPVVVINNNFWFSNKVLNEIWMVIFKSYPSGFKSEYFENDTGQKLKHIIENFSKFVESLKKVDMANLVYNNGSTYKGILTWISEGRFDEYFRS